MKELEFPFNAEYIQKKRKSIRRELLTDGTSRIKKKIAILGGSTTHDVMQMLELFLLNQGIEPEFYESEYAMWWEDVMFDAPELTEFHPDIIYIHTSTRNVRSWPTVRDDADSINEMLEGEYQHFVQVWEKIADVYKCPIIQNNFEEPFYRLLGNLDFSFIAMECTNHPQWDRLSPNTCINLHFLSFFINILFQIGLSHCVEIFNYSLKNEFESF